MHQLGSDFGFVARHSTKKAFRGFSSFGLDFCPFPTDTPSTIVKFTTRESKCFGVGRVGGGKYSLDSRVYPDNTSFGFCFLNNYFMAKDKIPIFPFLTEFRIFPSFNWRNSFVRNFNWTPPKAKPLLVERKISLPDNGNNFSSKIDRMPFLLGLLGQESCGNILEGRTCKLGRKPKPLPNGCIMFFMERIGINLLSRMDNRGNPVTGRKELFTDFIKLCGLPDLYLDCSNIIHYPYIFSDGSENSFLFGKVW